MPAGVVIIYFIVLFVIEMLYIKVASRYAIVDNPNHRSSHRKQTIRGGGVIFVIAMLLGEVYWGWKLQSFIAGLMLISLVSFLDDIKPVSKYTRIVVHIASVALLLNQLRLFNLPFISLILIFVIIIGIINAVNFMDGINGLTCGYAFITLVTLFYINNYSPSFTTNSYLILPIIAVVVFGFFNFRTLAKCFAGDVGSVGISFILIYFLSDLIIKTKDLSYLLLLLVYGLDALTTIFFRILRRENILEAHRSHFYQFLTNDKNISHLLVASLYMLMQGIINVVLLAVHFQVNLMVFVFIATAIFVIIRLITEGPDKLIKA